MLIFLWKNVILFIIYFISVNSIFYSYLQCVKFIYLNGVHELIIDNRIVILFIIIVLRARNGARILDLTVILYKLFESNIYTYTKYENFIYLNGVFK